MSARAAVLLLLAASPAVGQKLLDDWAGAAADDNFGRAVAMAGDVNGDGVDDVIVGAPFASPAGLNGAGRATIYSGATGAPLHVLNGAQAGERQGWSVAGVGDVDGDGRADVAVGVTNFDSSAINTLIGAVRVYSGATGAQLFQYVGPKKNSYLGSGVDGAGDWNGDGTPDIVAGASGYDVQVGIGFIDSAGWVGVISGSGPTLLKSFFGSSEHDDLGHSVAGGRDVNGGGEPDVVAGGWEATGAAGTYAGRVSVYASETQALVFSKYGTEAASCLGAGVDLGDVNGDDLADVIAGAYFEGGTKGASYVWFGPAGASGPVHVGSGTSDFFGAAVACVGDADHDGYEDYAVGAYETAPGNGYVRVYSGQSNTLLATLTGAADDDHFGISVGGRGDVNADGWSDILVGADLHDEGSKADAGHAYAYDLVTHQPNLGFGGPGTAFLDIYGEPLHAGGQADLHVSSAKANAPASLFASPLQNPAFFKGGVLVPDLATSFVLPLATSAQGTILLPGIKGGGGPFDVYVQIVIKDPTQTKGYALTNAVKMQFLP